MAETALTISPQISKLSKSQLKMVKKEAEAARRMEYLDKFAVPFLPVVAMVGGFLAIDYLEKKVRTPADPTATGPGGFFKFDFFTGQPNVTGQADTYLGPAAANVLRGGIVLAFAKQSIGDLSLF